VLRTSWIWQHKIAETCRSYLYIWTSVVSWKFSYLYWYNIKLNTLYFIAKLRYTQKAACKAEIETVSDSCCAWCCVRNPTRQYMAVCCLLYVMCLTQLAFIMSNRTHRSVLCSVQHNYWTAIVNCALNKLFFLFSELHYRWKLSHVTTADVTVLENGICSDIPEPYMRTAVSNSKSETHNHGLAKLRIRSKQCNGR
jgi:hypothetical protein